MGAGSRDCNLWNPMTLVALIPVRLYHGVPKELIMVRKIIIAIGVSSLALTAAACNTVRGVSDDLESAADAVDEET